MENSSAPKTVAPLGLLGLMMFLQFFIWGGWYVSAGPWLEAMNLQNAGGGLASWVYSVCPIAAIISPIFLGMIADRFFASQKVLGLLHIAGALFMFLIPSIVEALPKGATPPTSFFHPCVLLLLGHALCFMPTLALSSSVALAHIANAEKQFPKVRVAGTIGWIVACLAISLLLPGGEKSTYQFYVVGTAGLVLGLLSFLLPNTPPPLAGKQVRIGQLLGLDAISLLKKPQFAVFILCSLLVCIPLAGYYQKAAPFINETGINCPEFLKIAINSTLGQLSDKLQVTSDGIQATGWMTFGQMSEIFFMALMPVIILRLGVKKMLLVGMLAWVARYGLFALGAPEQVGWMVFIGILLHGICYDFFFVAGQIYVDNDTPHVIRGQAQSFFVLITQGVGMLIGAQVIGRIAAGNTRAVTDAVGVTQIVPDWQHIWLWPCIAAGVIAVIFAVFFKEKKTAPAE